MRKLFLLSMAVALILLSAGGAWAVTINWSDGIDHGNQGSSLVSGNLTITAKSGMPAGTDPLFSAYPGTIYWGKLGDMDADGKNDFYGLGVQNAGGTGKPGKPTTPSGSKGISGGGGDENEALIFTFANPNVVAGSVQVNLIGLNDTGNKTDHIDLYLEFIPIDNPSDVHKIAISFGSGSTYTADFGALFPEDVTKTFGEFAVVCTDGHIGVGGINYSNVPPPAAPVPIPGSVLLLGSGLVGVGLLGWRRRKTS